MIEHIKIKLQQLKQLKESLIEDLKVLIVDKSIPLEDRWNLFIESDLGIHKSYLERFDCKIGKDYIDNLEDKYTHHTVEQILDNIEDYELVYTNEEIIEYKENVLKSFIKSFEFDW